MDRLRCYVVICCLFLFPVSYAYAWILNNPYPSAESKQRIYYTSFAEQPKTLDPAKSYSSNESVFIGQIYEPLLEYDYLATNYHLIPLIAKELPQIRHVTSNVDNLPYTVYTIHIKPGILYQPHPAFAKDATGQYRYVDLPVNYLTKHHIRQLTDFKYTGTRELIVDDFIYQIKRLANPAVNSAVYGTLSEYIAGFKEYGNTLANAHGFVDLRDYPLSGVRKLDNYTFEVTLKGQYAQFIFWLAMPFFVPIPWEVDRFYNEPGMLARNISFGWYPVGTGPFMLVENNPNKHIVLAKNPNYRSVFLPVAAQKKAEYLPYAQQRLPLIDKAVYTLEKEFIPRWNKFLQGYYDLSTTSADSFDQAIQINNSGVATLSDELKEQGMRLTDVDDAAIFYLGFNMLDPIVGGLTPRARALRQALSIAINYDEDIMIFYNGRGTIAHGPIPPGIFGFRSGKAGMNPYVFTWDGTAPKLRPIEYAQSLLAQAGYPGGRNLTTGEPLILNYDVAAAGGPDDKARLNWMQKQFAKLGIALNIRATQYNQFQEKMRHGNAQIFTWGWSADYPDPENFLSLLTSSNSQVLYGGENAANYSNPEYDRLFEQMKNRPNDAIRQALIDKMVNIIQNDAPWSFGIFSKSFLISQSWIGMMKSNNIMMNTLKYMAVNPELRQLKRIEWNQPVLWPVWVAISLFILLLAPFIIAYIKEQHLSAKRM